jgi:hypothetical protein
MHNDANTDLSKTLPQTRYARLYTPFYIGNSEYETDLGWFGEHCKPKRRSYIRLGRDEFDVWDHRSSLPLPLWAHVIEVWTGFHLVYPLWRGPARFNTIASTDAEIAAIAADCFRQGGLDQDAWAKWQAGSLTPDESWLGMPKPQWKPRK